MIDDVVKDEVITPRLSGRSLKARNLEKKFDRAVKLGKKASAARIMRSFANLTKKPVTMTVNGFKPMRTGRIK